MADIFSADIPELLQEHFNHLRASAISVATIRERGYRSILGKKALRDAGFSNAQCHIPGILIPLHGTDGKAAGYQYRPNVPRTNPAGKTLKYENPVSSSVRLDVPTHCLAQLGNPAVPIWFTEGVKKVDALASAGACAIGLTGVWGFKGKNPMGGTTILADFDYISFKDRIAYLVFDSDVMNNSMVKMALDRLCEHLKRKGALPRILYLPAGPKGEKIGADDYLAQGHTLDEMMTCEQAVTQLKSLREHSAETYTIEDGRICFVKHNPDGESIIPLCNFRAHVAEDILKDNGQEITRFFQVRGTLPSGKALPSAEISAANFNSLNWITSEWGMSAIIAAGQNAKDRLREAVQLLSQEAIERHVYTHTGWREIDGKEIFLTSAGAIGAEDISVEMEPQLERYQIPQPAGDARDAKAAMQASLEFLNIGEHRVTLPLWAAIYLAPLSEILDPAFTLWYVGASGAYKSVITALAISHFGYFDHLHLPASWRDTANQLEKLLFLAKDLPLVIDDWAPGQDSAKARELEAKAEHIIRAQGNRQGKGRMRPDTSSRRNYTPRGILITSGEQLPSGHSHIARIYTVQIERENINTEILTQAQHNTQQYRSAMYHYILWLSKQWDELKTSLRGQWEDWRTKARDSTTHPRLPEAVASLYAGLTMGLLCAVDLGGLTQQQADEIAAEGWELFTTLSSEQGARIEGERPAIRFIEGLKAIISMGAGLLRDKADEMPKTPGPGQTAIGWRNWENGHILLDPLPAYQAVFMHYAKAGEPFTIKREAVWQDLKRMNYIDCDDGRTTKIEWVGDNSKRVIAIKTKVLEDS